MSVSNPLMSVVFEKDPTGKYKLFKTAIEAYAGTLCVELYEHGLAGQGLHLSCTEYATLHNGDERPIVERPVKPLATATKVAFELYKENREDFMKYTTATQLLKRDLMEACGVKIMRAMTTYEMPVPNMTITYIINGIEERYGVPSVRDVCRLQEDMRKQCTSEEEFYPYVQELQMSYDLLDQQRATVSEVDKMNTLMHGTEHLGNSKATINRYVVENPKLMDRSFHDMVTYINVQLPNFIGQDSAMSAHATRTISGQPLTPIPGPPKDPEPITRDELAQCFAQLCGHMAALTIRMPKGKRGGQQVPGTTSPQATAKVQSTMMYCFLHGTNKTHAGTNCRGMASPSSFTDKQRKATRPGFIDGRQGAN